MKVCLVKVSAPSPFKDYKQSMGGPPQNIFSAAATTPRDIDLSMVDETINMEFDERAGWDLVALFFSTPDAMRAYELADRLRDSSITVVAGGLHATFMTDEALEHADAVLRGEAEGVWEELLRDCQCGRLQRVYERAEPVDLADLRPYPTDLIPQKRYGYVWSVLVSRGCPHRCSFCTVGPFFGGIRYRPIQAVVDEIAASGASWVELHSDNLTANRDYALELFRAIEPLGVKWVGESTINMARDEALVAAAARSGLRMLLVGLETPSRAALKEAGKGFVSADEVRDLVGVFHRHGIQVDSSFVFGFDEHDPHIFRETKEFAGAVDLDEAHSVIAIPFPGTPFFEKLDAEGRILTRDWSKYDGAHAVFRPLKMTSAELEEGATWFHLNFAAFRTSKWSLLYGVMRAPLLPLLGVGLVLAGIVLDLTWLFGLLFLLWTAHDIRARRTWILGEVDAIRHPIFYWISIAMWGLLSVFYLASPFGL